MAIGRKAIQVYTAVSEFIVIWVCQKPRLLRNLFTITVIDGWTAQDNCLVPFIFFEPFKTTICFFSVPFSMYWLVGWLVGLGVKI